MVLKHNTLITITDGNIFVFWNFSFKVCNNACIMPSFCDFFQPFSPSSFKMKYSIKLKDDYIYFSDYLRVPSS